MERRVHLCLLWGATAVLYSVLSFTNFKSGIYNVYASCTVPQAYPQDTTRILITTRNSPVAVDNYINVNSSQAEELLKLPGVGPVLADRILKFRNENGPFKNIDELDKVKGIGPSKIERFRGRICF